MKISTRGRYGTRMMLDLAAHHDEGPTPLREIAKRQDLSVKYLEQLIIPLKAAGFIRSVRGARGGYTLARKPEKISIGQIIKTLEGGMTLVDCVEDPKGCERESQCLTREIWLRMSERLMEELSSLSLRDVLDGRKMPVDAK
ncbi:MAG: Rrf2 family transcriptional regulator [Deltaproteobacteria bacterium]|jgi:Rrf2 family protein|nr:Rrf2 family transcriptional regulator [Deltaproteobacteria bacterium]